MMDGFKCERCGQVGGEGIAGSGCCGRCLGLAPGRVSISDWWWDLIGDGLVLLMIVSMLVLMFGFVVWLRLGM